MCDCFINFIYSCYLVVSILNLGLFTQEVTWKILNLFRDCQREQVRQERLKIYKETGVWPKSQQKNKRTSQKQTEPWSRSKQCKMERKNKRERRKLKKQQQQNSGVMRRKRKRNLCQADIDELAKDIALIKKLKRKKVRVVN
jgi:hypothetical protein